MKKIIIAGGTGFIGQALVPKLLEKNFEVTIIGRKLNKIKNVFRDSVTPIIWDILENENNGIRQLRGADFLINLAGSNISSGRWTKSKKSELIQTRVQTTQLLSKICARLKKKAPVFINANGIGVYGIQKSKRFGLPLAITEENYYYGMTKTVFLTQLGQLWDESLSVAEEAGVEVIKLRFAPVLGKNGGMLPKLLLPFNLGLGGKIGNGRQPFSWVSIDDAIKAIIFIIEERILYPEINIVSPHTVIQSEFAKTLANVLGRPCFISLPSFLIKLIFGEMGTELLLQGQNVFPEVLLSRGFVFDYPDLEAALKHILEPR